MQDNSMLSGNLPKLVSNKKNEESTLIANNKFDNFEDT
jgi:hypothetical protein